MSTTGLKFTDDEVTDLGEPQGRMVGFLDPGFKKAGHHSDFLRIVIDYAQSHCDITILFFAPSDGWWPFDDLDLPGNFLPVRLTSKTPTGSAAKAAVTRCQVLREASNLAAPECESLVVIPFDGFQLPLLLIRPSQLRTPITALLFSPRPRPHAKRLTSLFRATRKATQGLPLILHPRLQRLVLLNDQPLADKLRLIGLATRTSVSSAPDPITLLNLHPTVEQQPLGKQQKMKVLAFGAQAPRKNSLRMLDAVELACNNDPNLFIEATVAGQFHDEAFRIAVEQKAQSMASQNNSVVRIIPHYLSDESRDELLRNSTVIFAAYEEFSGSSGLVSHSGSLGIPILVSAGGIMDHVVAEYDLGVTVDPSDPADIAEGLSRCSNKEISNASISRFRLDMSPENFVDVLIQPL